ncbi:unnamed protein product [Cladocopium goreaui]|uniref:Uncharacterized protein n=1 Tax=Cladocopium goreaui TaxID=2562237 RepID=A0A9P1GM11_9DINO|nr:unnamed protein product [Cladocopium goreaui]
MVCFSGFLWFFQSGTPRPRVAFADLEGQGDKGLEQDLKIATPLLIVSKARWTLLHSIRSTERILTYRSLQLLMMAGNCIAERKAQVGKRWAQASSGRLDLQDRRGLFGCLHIVLRDCAHDEVECRSIIFDHEDEVNAETDQHAKAMQKRNEIRKSIEISFEDVAPDDYTKANKEGFADKIDDIRMLTGSVIAALMPELAEAMRSNEPALNPPSLVDRVAAMEVQRAMDELVERAGKDAAAGASSSEDSSYSNASAHKYKQMIQSEQMQHASLPCTLQMMENSFGLVQSDSMDLQNDPRFFQDNVLNKRCGSMRQPWDHGKRRFDHGEILGELRLTVYEKFAHRIH